MIFGVNEVQQLLEEIWSCTLGWEIQPCAPFLMEGQRDYSLIGCVPLTGNWTGAVVLECHQDLAQECASIMFGTALEETNLDLVRDALGELTNMVAGNLKSLFDGQCFLGLPTVVNGKDYTVSLVGGQGILKVAFLSRDLPFSVEIVERRVPVNHPGSSKVLQHQS